MVKVLGFFAGRKARTEKEKCAAKKAPVVVVCSRKITLEIVRTNKESLGPVWTRCFHNSILSFHNS